MRVYALVVSLCILGAASAGMAAGAGSGGGHSGGGGGSGHSAGGSGHGVGGSGHGGASVYAGGVNPGSHGPGTANSFAATGSGLAGSNPGGISGPTISSGGGGAPSLTRKERYKALSDLRKEGLKTMRQDGGRLTQEHHATLQARLDRINGTPSTAN